MEPIISVASGKGGTGKTTFAVNLVYSLKEKDISYIDGDVEEPNGHIFLKPHISASTNVEVMIPTVNPDLCNGCGECSRLCQFNALAVLKDNVLVFPELCHGCGACIIGCPMSALKESTRCVGIIRTGTADDLSFIEGRLNEGEAKAPPVIKALYKHLNQEKIQIIDVSPGTSCPVIEGIRLSDFVVLVTEPTPFGLHDLYLAIQMVKKLGLPHGVVINRCDIGNTDVEDFCRAHKIPVLMQIPFRREIAILCSQGEIFISQLPEYKDSFRRCFDTIKEIIANSKKGCVT